MFKNKWLSLILIVVLLLFTGCSPQQLAQAQDMLHDAEALLSEYASDPSVSADSPIPSFQNPDNVNGTLSIHFLDVGRCV